MAYANAALEQSKTAVDMASMNLYTMEQANIVAQQVLTILYQQPIQPQNIDNLIDITDMARRVNVMSNMTMSEYARYWLETAIIPKRKASTANRYMTSIEALEKYNLARIQIKDITADDITNYLYEVADEYAHSTVKKQYTIVSAPLHHALGNKHIAVDVTKGITMPRPEDCKIPTRNTKDFSRPEQKALWAEIEKYESFCDYVLGFQLETGVRINEALALEWSDILYGQRPRVYIHKTVIRLPKEKKTIISPTPKTSTSNRNVPLTPKAVFILKKLQATAPNEWVFSDENGDRITYDSVRSRLKTICKRAGVKYQPTHANRHTLTTNLFEAGADHKAVSKILGHSDVAFTEKTYDHLRGDGYDQMYEAIMQIAQ